MPTHRLWGDDSGDTGRSMRPPLGEQNGTEKPGHFLFKKINSLNYQQKQLRKGNGNRFFKPFSEPNSAGLRLAVAIVQEEPSQLGG